MNNKTPLWLERPNSIESGNPSHSSILNKYNLFPSGRAALHFALASSGMNRFNSVRIPEYSSHCVVETVGRIASPTVRSPASMYIAYEQWGWGFSHEGKQSLSDSIENCAWLIDSVDTVCTQKELSHSFYADKPIQRVWSLGKTLGVRGAGMVSERDRFAVNINSGASQIPEEVLESISAWTELDKTTAHRIYSKVASEDVAGLLRDGTLQIRLEAERAIRQTHAFHVLENYAEFLGWDDWMQNGVLHDLIAPGLAPILRGFPKADLSEIQSTMEVELGIQSEVYHFDFRGHPISPKYEICLALPLHSGMSFEKFEGVFSVAASRLNDR